MSLALRLAELRRQHRESLQQVADAIGASKAHIWQIETGRARNPSMAVLKGLADHFGVSFASLVNEDGMPPDTDPELARMFRQVTELSEGDRQVLDELVQVLHRRKLNADHSSN